VRRQSIAAQNARTPAAAVGLVKLKPGETIVPEPQAAAAGTASRARS
jgi:hypothetical protein